MCLLPVGSRATQGFAPHPADGQTEGQRSPSPARSHVGCGALGRPSAACAKETPGAESPSVRGPAPEGSSSFAAPGPCGSSSCAASGWLVVPLFFQAQLLDGPSSVLAHVCFCSGFRSSSWMMPAGLWVCLVAAAAHGQLWLELLCTFRPSWFLLPGCFGPQLVSEPVQSHLLQLSCISIANWVPAPLHCQLGSSSLWFQPLSAGACSNPLGFSPSCPSLTVTKHT
ncbi:uncharacterized protein LOC127384185 [Apus apus]|uniref:uncharacterized protein LOC127384185 n=1 Tax=Apus apus TaxID=8895 RepID=UPI0021F8CDDF|nr:uncharacterized protein LOC127384185 [Apus apus]